MTSVVLPLSEGPVNATAKDLMLFNENYNINAIHFFDFFPYTNHIETLVLMSKECR